MIWMFLAGVVTGWVILVVAFFALVPGRNTVQDDTIRDWSRDK